MALVKDTNSYVSLAEADLYFVDRLDVAAWTNAVNAEKEKALVTATACLDGLNWTGAAISETQALAFPRYGSYFDPKLGIQKTLSDAVPTRIITATYELAYHLLNNDGLLDDTGSVTSLSVGQISLNIRTEPNKVPPVVMNIIRPLLLNGGRRTWWRAN